MLIRLSLQLAAVGLRRFLPLLLLVPLMPSVLFAAPAELLSQGRELLAAGQNEEAYQLLQAQSLEHAGTPDYDYLLGLAALRAGHPGQAMFALERAVQIQPGYAAARMELVSAYLQLGLDKQAQAQLAILEKQNPPEAAREAMSRYQEILRPRLSATPDAVRLIALSAGQDSNAGSYPDMGLDLGGLQLSVEPVESAYTLLRGTIWQPVRLNASQQLDFTLHGQTRRYQDTDATQFNLGLLHSGFLLNTTMDASNRLGLGLQMNKLWLDGSRFRDHLGANTFWERRLGAGSRGQVGLKLHRYQFAQSSNNYDLQGLSGELRKRWSPGVATRLLLDVETEQADADRPGGDALRYIFGARLSYRLSQRNRFATEVSWKHTDYDEKYEAGTLYNTGSSDEARSDNSLDLALRWHHTLARDWQVDTDLTWRQQDSTIGFYDVDRWTAQLSVLRYF